MSKNAFHNWSKVRIMVVILFALLTVGGLVYAGWKSIELMPWMSNNTVPEHEYTSIEEQTTPVKNDVVSEVMGPERHIAAATPHIHQQPKYLSYQGRQIAVNVFGEAAETVLVFGGIHGDERESVELARALNDHLHTMSPQRLGKRVIVIPIANPDGYEVNTRVNARKIDINRNFPTKDFGSGASTGRYFGGTTPASEPETRVIMEVIETYRPSLIISIHSPLACVNYDGPAEDIARAMAKRNGLPLKPSIGYPTPGSFGTYYGKEKQLPVITLELKPGLGQWEQHRDALLEVIGVTKLVLPALPQARMDEPLPKVTRIVVSKAQNVVQAYSGDTLVRTYLASTGIKNCSPTGSFRVTGKSRSPGKPDLGTRWLALNRYHPRTGRQYGIHGTDEPELLGTQSSRGCVRLHNQNIEELYEATAIGTTVIIKDEPILLPQE